MHTKIRGQNVRIWKRFQDSFADRQVIIRKGGADRVFTLTRKLQLAGTTMAATGMAAVLAATGSFVIDRQQINAERTELHHQEVQVADAQQRIAAYRDELDSATSRLQKRQAFLEKMVEMLPADLLADASASDDAAEGSDAEAAALTKLGAALPEAAGLSRIEHRQLASVDRLTRFAESRATKAESAIRRLGLDPSRIMSAPRGGMGGPLETLDTGPGGSLDPRFARSGQSLSRMAALEQGLESIPQVMPTALARMTSNFGYRSDPFTGEAALHAGLDFAGAYGDPIHAAADGKVSFVGNRAGYGKVVEITHANGLLTRYAHMSAWKARPGQIVRAGETIGAIGSTGRSTGPHLHFEVRIGDHAVNPRPFLENAPELIAEVRS